MWLRVSSSSSPAPLLSKLSDRKGSSDESDEASISFPGGCGLFWFASSPRERNPVGEREALKGEPKLLNGVWKELKGVRKELNGDVCELSGERCDPNND